MKQSEYRKQIAELHKLVEAPPSMGAPIARPSDKRVSMDVDAEPMGAPPISGPVGKEPSSHEDDFTKDLKKMAKPGVIKATSQLGKLLVGALGAKEEPAFGKKKEEPSKKEAVGRTVDQSEEDRKRKLRATLSKKPTKKPTPKKSTKKEATKPTTNNEEPPFEYDDWDREDWSGSRNEQTQRPLRQLARHERFRKLPWKPVKPKATAKPASTKKEATKPKALSRSTTKVTSDPTKTYIPKSNLTAQEVKAIDANEKAILRFAKKAFGEKPLGVAHRAVTMGLEKVGIADKNSGRIADVLAKVFKADGEPETKVFQKVLPRIAQIPNTKAGGYFSGGSGGAFKPMGG